MKRLALNGLATLLALMDTTPQAQPRKSVPTPRRFTDARIAAAEAKQQRKAAKRARDWARQQGSNGNG